MFESGFPFRTPKPSMVINLIIYQRLTKVKVIKQNEQS